MLANVLMIPAINTSNLYHFAPHPSSQNDSEALQEETLQEKAHQKEVLQEEALQSEVLQDLALRELTQEVVNLIVEEYKLGRLLEVADDHAEDKVEESVALLSVILL